MNNIKRVLVLDRQGAVDLTINDFSLDRVIISISSMGDEYPCFDSQNGSIKDALYLSFNDDLSGPYAIKWKDARAISEFVHRNMSQDVQFVVHCDAGVSRSAGVGAAILNYLGLDDYILCDEDMSPNSRCYRMTVEAMCDYDRKQKKKNEEKIVRNIVVL